MASHYRLRKRQGSPLTPRHGLRGYPYTSWLAIAGLLAILASMPLIPGQGGGLAAGIMFVVFFAGIYTIGAWRRKGNKDAREPLRVPAARAQMEAAEEPGQERE